MRFGLEALVTAVCLSGVAACRPAAGQASNKESPPLPPGPPAGLERVIAEQDRASLAALPPGPGRVLVEGNCVICHGATMIQQQHKDSAGWVKTVKQMRAWGAPLPEGQEAALIDYLTKHYGATGQ